MVLKGKDIIRAADYTKEELYRLFKVFDEVFLPMWKGEKPYERMLEGKVIANIFFQPSTRTTFSFESAMTRLGGGYISHSGPENLSIGKGESFEDHIRMLDMFADLITLRHPKESSAKQAAQVARVPVLNCGNGNVEHPIHMPDVLCTIKAVKGKLEGLSVAMMGDCKLQRCAHSVVYGFAMLGMKVVYTGPEKLAMPEEINKEIKEKYNANIAYMDLDDALRTCDVLYSLPIVEWAGAKDVFKDYKEYYEVKTKYRLDLELLRKVEAREDMLLMTPGPRLEDIYVDIDDTKYDGYWPMYKDLVPLRMAHLALTLGAIE